MPPKKRKPLKRMGRPLKLADKFDVSILVKVDAKRNRLYRRLATKAGLTLSGWIRLACDLLAKSRTSSTKDDA